MHEILLKNPYPDPSFPNDKSEVSSEQISRELKQLELACDKLRADCEVQKQLIAKLELNIHTLKSQENPLPS